MAFELKVSSFMQNFSIDIYKKLHHENRNIFLSPLSISTVLAMTSLGAKGKTLEQLRNVLHIQDITDENFHQTFADMVKNFNERIKNYTLLMANKLFLQDKFPINVKYIESADKYYNGGIITKDFCENAEKSRIEINTWVEEQTKNRIQDVLPPGILNKFTRLVLVNAIYFKGNWMKQFDEANTTKHQFHLNQSETKEVDMMYQKSKFKFTHCEDLKCKLLELPYTEGHLSMFVLLPDEIEGLPNLEDKLSTEVLNELVSILNICEVHLRIPKFKMTAQFSLKNTLIELGLIDMFADEADLSDIYGQPGDLLVDAVEHKAFIEVNEEGSEAAAATAVVIRFKKCAFLPQPEIYFTADHPFLFFIRDNTSGVIFFMGKLIEPCS